MDVYVKDGKLVSHDQLNLGYNSSFLYGINAFEGVAAYRDPKNKLVCFKLKSHMARLENSSKVLGLNYDEKEILKSIKLALSVFASANHVYLRVILYEADSKTWARTDRSNILVQAYEVDRPRNAVSCAVLDMMKGDAKVFPPEVKCGANYANSRLGKLKAQHAGCDLPIYQDKEGCLTESGGAALILLAENALWTYPWNGKILRSITVKSILEHVDYRVHWKGFPAANLASLTAACLVGTALEVVPIKRINTMSFPDYSNALSDELYSALHFAIREDQTIA